MTGSAPDKALAPSVPTPTFAEATRVWWSVGILSFGGPAGQIALMHRMLVEERRWISEERFLHALNFCMLLPGPEAQQLATYIGWLLHGTRGGLVAGTLFVLPGFVVMLMLSSVYALFHQQEWLVSIFFGLKAAVLALVLEALLRLGRRALKDVFALIVAGLAFLGIFAFQVPFPVVILAAGLVGYLRASVAAPTGGPSPPEIVIGPRAGVARAVRILLIAGGLWAGPVLAVGVAFGWGSIFPALGLFFSKMAVVTFGGAYAVLAYVASAAVSSFGWLSPGEMLDGLALAETTPGPLILVLTYVGFLAAFHAPAGLAPLVAGLIGATLTTWVTFVPCFLWIFLGAPYVERLRGNRALGGALTAITAAVVGVILSLGLFLAAHVLFREVTTFEFGLFRPLVPVLDRLDTGALAVFVFALIAVFRMRLGVLQTLGISALLGVVIATWLEWS